MHVHKPGRFFLVAFIAILVVIAADQASKWLVLETMLRTKSENPDFWAWFSTRDLIGDFVDQREAYNTITYTPWLNFTMVWNKGVSFGMFGGENALPPIVFIGFSLVVSMGMMVWLVLARSKTLSIALPLIIGGAIANSIDRFRFGAVADFIDVHVGDKHWPAFNLADSCIVLGACFIVLDALLTAMHKKPQQ